MEARVILCELLRNYTFTLAEPTLAKAAKGRQRTFKDFIAMNAGTMSPKHGIWLNVVPRASKKSRSAL